MKLLLLIMLFLNSYKAITSLNSILLFFVNIKMINKGSKKQTHK